MTDWNKDPDTKSVVRFIYEDLLYFGYTLDRAVEEYPKDNANFIGKKWHWFLQQYGIFND